MDIQLHVTIIIYFPEISYPAAKKMQTWTHAENEPTYILRVFILHFVDT